MKVPISEDELLDLEAPVLLADEAVLNGSAYWLIWCNHCGVWHRYGSVEGLTGARVEASLNPLRRTVAPSRPILGLRAGT